MVHQVEVYIKKEKNKFFFVVKESVNIKEIFMTWIQIRNHVFSGEDPRSGFASKDQQTLAVFNTFIIIFCPIQYTCPHFSTETEKMLKFIK